MSASQRRKGADGEREVVELLHAHGYVLEVKRHRGRLDLPAAVRQVESACASGDVPVVAHRRDGEPWRATPPLEDLLELLEWRDRG